MTDDVTPECPRCRESREALARERERTYSAATEMLNAARLSCRVLGDMLAARAVLGAAPSETVQEAAARVVSERDEARAEVARMRDQRDRAELMDAAVAVRAARIEQEALEVDVLRAQVAMLGARLAVGDDPVLDATDAAHPAWWRGHADGCLGMERALQEARDEVARLRAIIDGRTDPPTPEESAAHGGQWLVAFYGGRSEVHDYVTARREAVEERWLRAGGNSARPRWWPLDGDGRLCAWPVVTEDVSAHEWVTRVAVAVCARCGVVRSADRETPCRGSLPGVGLRERAAETPEEDVWADIEVARALDAADGSALPPLPTSSTLRTRR